MEKTGWKVLAIILMIIFLLEIITLIFFYKVGTDEVEKDELCAYDICAEYPQAERTGNVCYCYDYDLMGTLQISKTELMR